MKYRTIRDLPYDKTCQSLWTEIDPIKHVTLARTLHIPNMECTKYGICPSLTAGNPVKKKHKLRLHCS